MYAVYDQLQFKMHVVVIYYDIKQCFYMIKNKYRLIKLLISFTYENNDIKTKGIICRKIKTV